MNYYSEKDIEAIVAGVLAKSDTPNAKSSCESSSFPVEVSARHVHLTQEAVEALFGKGYQLTKKRELSQPGEFLSGERVKVVTAKGQLASVSVLGPLRKAVQTELSLTDSRTLGIDVPVRLSGDLSGAANVLLIGPAGCYDAKGSAIVAKAHIHMTQEDAKKYHVQDGETVSVRLQTERPVTLDDVVVRVDPTFALAMHIDFDEANAALVGTGTVGSIVRKR